MAKSLKAPDAFPGASVPRGSDAAVAETVTPGDVGPQASSFQVLRPPDAFPGGNQIPAGAPDTTGSSGQAPRMKRSPAGGGTLP